jgi:hypothetical protein
MVTHGPIIRYLIKRETVNTSKYLTRRFSVLNDRNTVMEKTSMLPFQKKKKSVLGWNMCNLLVSTTIC